MKLAELKKQVRELEKKHAEFAGRVIQNVIKFWEKYDKAGSTTCGHGDGTTRWIGINCYGLIGYLAISESTIYFSPSTSLISGKEEKDYDQKPKVVGHCWSGHGAKKLNTQKELFEILTEFARRSIKKRIKERQRDIDRCHKLLER